LQDAQILFLLELRKCICIELRGGNHFKVDGIDELGCRQIKFAVHDHSPAKGSDAVCLKGPLQGHGHAFICPGGTTGIVVLEDQGGRLGRQVLQNIEGIVHVGQVGLARVLACLEHVFLGQGGNKALSCTDELDAADFQTAFGQFVQCSGLIRVLSVAEALGLAVDFPGALFESQFLVAQRQFHFSRKRILLEGLVHVLQITHIDTPFYSHVRWRSYHSFRQWAIADMAVTNGRLGCRCRQGEPDWHHYGLE